ncbi:MAG: hypothetical protein OXT74_13210 [Candidatus Poribacteria bacterium]|nr:hypothetical protein [Candidatus Poribacteria bacterium]
MGFDYFTTLFPILTGIVGIFFLITGLKGLLTKRPFLISNVWMLVMMFVIFVPMGLSSVMILDGDPMSWVVPLLYSLVLVVMCYQLKGFVAFAVTDTSFREALVAALQRLELPYEESLSVIRLTSVEADLQVSIQSWMGTGVIKTKHRAHRSMLKEVVDAMNEYFRTSSVSTNMITCVFWVVMGVALPIVGFSTFFLLRPFNL